MKKNSTKWLSVAASIAVALSPLGCATKPAPMFKTAAQFQDVSAKTNQALNVLESLPPGQRKAYVATHQQDFFLALTGGLPEQSDRYNRILKEQVAR